MHALTLVLTVFALTLTPLASAAPLAVTADSGSSLTMKVQLENTHVHRDSASVHALVNLSAVRNHSGGEQAVNLALVIDRSGSMQGQKISDARAAAMKMVELLRAGDRVSIVSYSDGVRVDLPSVVIDRRTREAVKDAIRRVGASGSTNLSSGMIAGQQEVERHLDSDKVNRVILISDGLANRGITALPQLNRIAREAAQKGIVTSTLGLGADYNEDLMTAVADHGGGNYYFVQHSDQIASVLQGELSQMMATVARQATLEVTLPAGVAVEEVYGYAWQAEGRTVVVRLGDVFAGQTRAILWKLRATDASVGTATLGTLKLHYRDATTSRNSRRSASASLAIKITTDRSAVTANLDKDVAARIAEIELATSMQKAALLVQEGRYEDARQTLQRATRKAKDNSRSLGSAGAGLSKSAEEAEALADDLAAPPASAREQKAYTKKAKAGAYKLRKK